MSDTLALAAFLAALDEAGLRALTQARPIATPEAVRDPLGLATQLLRTDSLTRAVQALTIDEIDALQAFAAGERGADHPSLAGLSEAGLVGLERGEPVPLREVGELLASLLPGARPGDSRADRSLESPASDPAPDAHWYAPALTAVRLATELVRVLGEHPITLSQRGALTTVALRELATRLHCHLEVAADLAAIAQAAGLARPHTLPGRRRDVTLLAPTHLVSEWLQTELPERWLQLVAALFDTLTPPLRWLLGSEAGASSPAAASSQSALDRLRDRYPLLPQAALTDAETLLRRMETVGLTVHGQLAGPGVRLLRGGLSARDDALVLAQAGFPPNAPGIYLQPDLSIIIPGPLTASDEQALRALTDIEQLGVASTLRVSPASLHRAHRGGSSPAEMRSLLARLSLTGVPQPVDFLLSELDRTPANTHDSAAHHGITHHGSTHHGATRHSPAGHGTAHDHAQSADATAPQADEVTAMIERVLEAARSTPETGDLTRRLELAIRDRTAVRVTAEASGQQRTFVLLPVALSGGRLRATDEAAGVQRTLPLTAIREVATA